MKLIIKIVLFTLLMSVLLYSYNPVTEKALKFDLKTVNAEKIRSHIKFLSHDLLEGRGIDSKGSKVAALYIESMFRAYSLQPMGDSYIRPFDMNAYSSDKDAKISYTTNGKRETLKFGDDFICGNFTYEKDTFEGEPVFIGYGIDAPSFNWNDYKDFDVRGKLLIGFTNEPGREDEKVFRGKALTWYGRWVYKYLEAARRGAAGLILIHTDDDAGYSWDVVRNSWSGKTFRLSDDPDILPLQLWIRYEKAEKILISSGYNLTALRKLAESRDFKPVPLNLKLRIESRKSSRQVKGRNIAGIIPGNDPNMRDKAIVFSAHYDHLGIGREINGDKIYNGAVDNCSASATLLTMAEEYGFTKENRVTLIFVSVDAEEEGLLGSHRFASNISKEYKPVLANINFEMSNVWGPTSDVIAIGAEHSDLESVISDVLKRRNMKITPDPIPEQGYFFRSDQFSFARAGIPAVWIDTGYNYLDRPENWGLDIRAYYRLNRYHQPSDEYSDEMDLRGLVQLAGIAKEAIKEIEKRGSINWNEGSEFKR